MSLQNKGQSLDVYFLGIKNREKYNKTTQKNGEKS